MKPRHMLRIVSIATFLGMASFALPQPAHARVHVSVGLGLPIPITILPAPPVVVRPAPVVVARPPVVIVRPWRRVWLFCYNASNPGLPVSCPVMSCPQHCPPEMSCRCGRALGISENLV